MHKAVARFVQTDHPSATGVSIVIHFMLVVALSAVLPEMHGKGVMIAFNTDLLRLSCSCCA
jgi:hypothetical protein